MMGTRRSQRLAAAIFVLASPASADAAPPPWSTPLSTTDEAAVLDEVSKHRQLDERGHEQLVAAASEGDLLVTGGCVRVDPSQDWLPNQWLGEVESIATLQVSNLSDHSVWLVDLQLVGADEHGQLGVARLNLPFLPPHNQAEVTLGCDGVHPFAVVLDRVRVSGSAAPLTRASARRLATTPARFFSSAPFGNLVIARSAGDQRLAGFALPRVDDRVAARLLMTAMLVDRPPPKSIGEWLGQAGTEAAQGIVDALLARPPAGLDEILQTALRFGSGTNPERDQALARLTCPLLDSLAPARREDWLVDALFASDSAGWDAALLGACPLDADSVAHLVESLASDRYDKRRPLRELSGFIALAPDDKLELALPALLGGDASAGVVDGGLRPIALWRAMASLPAPPRLAALEALVRPGDIEAALPLLVDAQMSDEQFALFDRIAARVDELPPEQRGAALLPTFHAARDTRDPALIQRLLDLAEHDPATLRPVVLPIFAERQRLLSAEGVAVLPHRAGLVAQVAELSDCPDSLAGLRRCLDAFAADPALDHAASLGLHEVFLSNASSTLSFGDPTAEQVALIRSYLAYGLAIDPIATQICMRASQRLHYDDEIDSHLEFLREFAPAHRCTVSLEARIGSARRRLMVFAAIAAAALALIGLAFAYNRRRSTKISEL